MATTSESSTAGETPALDDAFVEVEHALTHLARLSRPSRYFGEILDTNGLPLDRAAYSVLTRIEEFGPIRLTDLAIAMQIDLSTASRQVRSLEQRGLLERAGEPGDLRARRLRLTEDGVTVLIRSRWQRLAGIRRRLQDWSPEEICSLAGLLGKLAMSFGASPSGTKLGSGAVPASSMGST